MDAAPKPDGERDGAPAKTELPMVESPPLSPAYEFVEPPADLAPHLTTPEPIEAPRVEAPVAASPFAFAEGIVGGWSRFVLRPRHKRYALLAASVTFAAALGAVIGALASGGSAPPPPKPDVAAIEQNKALQQSIAKLNKEVAALKANLELSSKNTHTQIAKISEKLEHQAAEITGSIAAPQSVAATVPAPLPPPRPTQRLAALPPPPAHVPVVAGWSIHDIRNGYVFVESHGAVYQVQIGAPLPGLGPVQSVKREDGRWTVVTPKGIIVSQRDRRYFADF